jgi:hypothetical protein
VAQPFNGVPYTAHVARANSCKMDVVSCTSIRSHPPILYSPRRPDWPRAEWVFIALRHCFLDCLAYVRSVDMHPGEGQCGCQHGSPSISTSFPALRQAVCYPYPEVSRIFRWPSYGLLYASGRPDSDGHPPCNLSRAIPEQACDAPRAYGGCQPTAPQCQQIEACRTALRRKPKAWFTRPRAG